MLVMAPVSPPGIPPSEWLYIIAAIGTLIGTLLVIRSAWAKYVKQRQDEAVKNAELQKAITGNADATRENTAALQKMGQDFHDFVRDVRAELNGHAERIGRLEHPSP